MKKLRFWAVPCYCALFVVTRVAGGPCFSADYNRRFAKPRRNDWDAHSALREDEELDLIFTFREKRKVSHVLTLKYDKVIYLLEDSKVTRLMIGRHTEVFEHSNGRIELRADGTALPYAIYDRLSEVSQRPLWRTSGSGMRWRS